MGKKKIVALLPIKARSERISGKNFRSFAGKPLFKWILEALLSVDEIDNVVINTDARQQLIDNGLVESGRILIRDRDSELCGDLVSMNLIISNDVNNVPADVYLMTHATNPLLSKETISSALEQFIKESGQYDSLFTVNKVQSRFYKKDLTAVNHDPENLVRTQDLEPWYEENSCLYLFTKNSFQKTKARIGEKPLMFEIPKLESVDIDEPDDWEKAEALALYRLERGEI